MESMILGVTVGNGQARSTCVHVQGQTQNQVLKKTSNKTAPETLVATVEYRQARSTSVHFQGQEYVGTGIPTPGPS